jgi:predicted NBD/HSP70 family sugar kinase
LCLDYNNPENTKVALVNLNNEIVDFVKVKISKSEDYYELLQSCYDESMRLLAKHSIPIGRLLGVGVAIPGIYYKKNKSVINSTNRLIENKFLKTDIEEKFGLPVFLENESNLLALASMLKDKERGSIRISFISIWVKGLELESRIKDQFLQAVEVWEEK